MDFIADDSMLELFRQEAETHSETLTQGLVNLEQDQNPDTLQELMRAAHSIKGAARIVGLNQAVDLAHSMEDVLVQAQKGRVLNSGDIDALLSGTDFFADMAGLQVQDFADYLNLNQGRINETVDWISGKSGPVEAEPDSTSIASETTPEPAPAPEPSQTSKPAPEANLLADDSMLELFRQEAETHSETLNQGLVNLEQDQNPDTLQELMRAAHSIKGAARIVGLNQAVDLAHAMEDVLVQAQKGRVLNSGDIDALLAGTDFFADMAGLQVQDFADYLNLNQGRINETVDWISGKSGPVEAEPDSASIDSETTPEPAPAPEPSQTSKPAPEANLLADDSMLELFRQEAETHSETLTQGLVNLEQDQNPDTLQELMRAAHSIKGAARIVGLNQAVDLAHSMEDVLVQAQKGRVLNSGDIDALLAGTDFFADMAGLQVTEFQNYLGNNQDKIFKTMDWINGKSGPVDDTPDTSPETEPAKPVTTAPTPSPKPISAPASNDRSPEDTVVRLSGQNLTDILALAGECMVETAQLGPFMKSLLQLKNSQQNLMSAIESIRDQLLDSQDNILLNKIVDIKTLADNCRFSLSDHMIGFERFSRRSESLHDRLHSAVQQSRMRPFKEGMLGFPRLVRDISKKLGKDIRFVVRGENTKVDRDILDKLEAPLNHIIRNAADHGIEMPEIRDKSGKPVQGTISVEASHKAGMLVIVISDDGRGLDPERIRQKVVERKLATHEMASRMNRSELMEFLFLPGFSTAKQVTEISGRGVGLDVVHNMVKEVGGTVKADSIPGKGMSFELKLPLTLSIIRTLIVDISGEPFAIPLTRIDHIVTMRTDDLCIVEDRQFAQVGNDNIGIIHGSQLLDLPQSDLDPEKIHILVISDRMNKFGLVVDKFLEEQDLVVRPLDQRFGKVPDIQSVARMADGSPVLILDIEDVVRSIDNLLSGTRLKKTYHSKHEQKSLKRILVVDDSLTVREVEKKLLENNGYFVETAVDGMDGFNALTQSHYDLVVTDVDMPRMDGISLVKKIRSDLGNADLPVMIVSYKDREEDKIRGLEAGANYYLTKSSFHDEGLLKAVYDLIGEP